MRKLLHDDKYYWIGHHHKLGLLIYDPEAQGGSGDRVRLFKVSQQEARTFIKSIIRTTGQWSSDEEHLPSMQRAVTEYAQVRARLRETHCYRCRVDLNSADFSICGQCNWIRCPCGACGCRYTGPR